MDIYKEPDKTGARTFNVGQKNENEKHIGRAKAEQKHVGWLQRGGSPWRGRVWQIYQNIAKHRPKQKQLKQ